LSIKIKCAHILVEKLRKGGIKIKKNAVVTVQNIVSSINLGGRVHLKKRWEFRLFYKRYDGEAV